MSLMLLTLLASAACVGVLVWIALRSLPGLLSSQRRHFQSQVGLGLRAVAIYINPTALWIGLVFTVTLVGAFSFVFTKSMALTFLLVAILGFGPRILIKWMRQRYLKGIRRQLPDAMRLLAAGLKAGAGLWTVVDLHAKELPNPLRLEFEMVVREQRLGAGIESSLTGLQVRCPVEEVALFVALLRMAHGTGGGMTNALLALAESCQRKLELESKADALTAQGKLQAIIMGLLPGALLLVLSWVDPPSAQLLTHTFNGNIALALAGVLQLLGFVFVRRIVRVVV